VELPEEPISASATIAMSATRSVDIPAGTRGGSAHVQPGELISHVQPDYPVESMQEKVEGTVKLRLTVAKDGTIKQIEPMGGPPALVGSSVSAVQQWRYRPTYVNGKPAEVQDIVEIVFRLPPSSGNSNSNP
jgi:outer membrane biosynthesis protein TonB